eukprot:6182860-Pleurochrysis_carterae.AAC.2
MARGCRSTGRGLRRHDSHRSGGGRHVQGGNVAAHRPACRRRRRRVRGRSFRNVKGQHSPDALRSGEDDRTQQLRMPSAEAAVNHTPRPFGCWRLL